jgi:hypothetical protein
MQNHPLNDPEVRWIEKMQIEVRRKYDILTDFEKKFCADLFRRFAQFGVNTNISMKEWKIIYQITDKVIR